MGVWLLFFPNCLYMLTDLIHLRQIADAPVWLDLIIVLSFAWAGLCYGFVSLMDIESFLKERFHAAPKIVNGLSVSMIYLAAFGICTRRFLRWNSGTCSETQRSPRCPPSPSPSGLHRCPALSQQR